MSATFERVGRPVKSSNVRASRHAARRLLEFSIPIDDLLAGIAAAEVIEDDPDYHAGPSVLVLCWLDDGSPVHSVWGFEKGSDEPAVLVTVYRPNPDRWPIGFRKPKP